MSCVVGSGAPCGHEWREHHRLVSQRQSGCSVCECFGRVFLILFVLFLKIAVYRVHSDEVRRLCEACVLMKVI